MAALVTAAPLHAATADAVNGLRIGLHGDTTRVVLDLDRAMPYRAFVMTSPYRLAIDLPAFEWKVGKVGKPAGSGVSNVRQGELNEKISRIIVDLNHPVAIKTAFVIKGPSSGGSAGERAGGSRLVIDFSRVAANAAGGSGARVFGTLKDDAHKDGARKDDDGKDDMPKGKPAAPSSAQQGGDVPMQTVPSGKDDDEANASPPTRHASAPQPGHVPTPPPAPASKSTPIPTSTPVPAPNQASRAAEKPLIVIDPGHGGVDPGSLGVGGLFEKNVTIGMARELKKELEATGRYRVLLTRDTDVYLKLGERVAFARDRHANLFISLHADSINRSNVSGASIYTLSEKASDAQTARLADRENSADRIEGVDIKDQDQQVATILVDLVMRDNMNQSKFFANSVVAKMKREGIDLLENTQRSAGFAVLKAPDIPSVLIELGFMTNARESALLTSTAYRRKVSEALVAGIDSYFHTVGKTNRP